MRSYSCFVLQDGCRFVTSEIFYLRFRPFKQYSSLSPLIKGEPMKFDRTEDGLEAYRVLRTDRRTGYATLTLAVREEGGALRCALLDEYGQELTQLSDL
jgi:hypothetical protein